MIKNFLNEAQTIYTVDNVLSEEDLAYMENYCLEEDGWTLGAHVIEHTFYIKRLKPREFSIMQENIIDNVLTTLEPELTTAMSMPLFKHSHESTIEIPGYNGGWSIPPHKDISKEEDNLGTIRKTLIFFVNDNYVGGEYTFLDGNVVVKPKKNSLLVCSSPDAGAYGATEVTDGFAYTFAEYLFDK